MKNHLIFGAFNPPTNAHLGIAESILDKYPDAQIIYYVAPDSYMHYWKKMDWGTFLEQELRVDLLRESIEARKDLVSNCSVIKQNSEHCFEEIENFKKEHGDNDTIIVVGADKIQELHTWYRGYELVKNNKFLVIKRRGDSGKNLPEILQQFADHFEHIDGFEHEQFVSATHAREAFKDKDWNYLANLVPAPVFDYLKGMAAFCK